MTNKIYKKTNWWKLTLKSFVISLLIGILFTFALSLIMGFKYKQVVTSSMEPTYRTKKCIIVVAPCDYYDDVEIGDVITWGDEKTVTITHRVVDKTEITLEDGSTQMRWVARGDNPTINEDNTQIVSPSNFIGKVVYHSNFVGSIFNYIQNNIFLMAFCVVVIFLVCVIVL